MINHNLSSIFKRNIHLTKILANVPFKNSGSANTTTGKISDNSGDSDMVYVVSLVLVMSEISHRDVTLLSYMRQVVYRIFFYFMKILDN